MRTSPPLRLLAPAALLAALGGCAALGMRSVPPDPSLLTESRAARPRECRPVEVPAELPRPEHLVDTAALDAAVAELREAGLPLRGHLLLSMGYAPDGTNVRRAVIEHTLRPRAADSLQQLVFAHRRALPRGPAEWGVRLRLDLDGQVRYRVGRREVCAPRVTDPLVLDGSTGTMDRRPPTAGAYQTVWVRIHVDELGRVTDARVERGMVRRGPLELLLMNHVRSLSFEPAREDGRPVPIQLSLPVRIPW